MRRGTALFVAITLVSACARNRYTQAPTVPSDDPAFSAPEVIVPRGIESDPPEALALLAGDVVQLTTVSAKTETFEGLIVDAMGQLHVPLAGDINVGGKTLSQAEKAIETGLRRYDRFVRANLIITRLDGHTAAVVGAVQTPGRFEVRPGMRLADLLALSGGASTAQVHAVPTLTGSLELARLVRDGETVPVSLLLARQGDPKHNIRIRAGDHLYVPPVTDRMIMVLGEVVQAQPMAYRTGIRLTEVLARAGGVDSARGDRKDIRIVRGSLREPQIYTTNLKALMSGKATDVELAPGDIVYVTKAWYASASDVLSALSPILSLANSVAILAVAGAITR
ncbi:MAG: SLBB domain-containing protein [Deltaproteobacteria bacterium]|nr:SLBB domain-containing protein [Deltaproteobacteria bacterium]